MKILITGGAGFIGRHLVELLHDMEHDVTVFDNFSNSEKAYTLRLVDNGVKMVEGDITDPQSVTNAIRGHDVVVHLAAKISVEESIKNPSETFRVNIDGTKNILHACEKNNIRKLIVASSAAVYGEGLPDTGWLESSELKPISPYGKSKMLMEEEIKKFILKHDINCVILRFFNVYGVGQSSEYAGVITKFIKRIEINQSLEIFGDGEQVRDFVAVQDVAAAIYQAIRYGKNGTYNIASGNAITIKKLAEVMISLSKKNLKIQYREPKKGDIKYSRADITSAKKDLQYAPKFGLDEIKNLFGKMN